jgi:alpha-methylacyl-CoA racemase
MSARSERSRSAAGVTGKAAGPLAGIKVLEIESIGPGPFAAMVLADFGANVLRIARPAASRPRNPVLSRGRAGTIALDLKAPAGRVALVDLVTKTDALIEGFRPGVMERLGLGPEPCLEANPRLVYGRITGWGRCGPLAHAAGHDINYIALSGALHACGTAESGPVPPLNLVGDFGGGGMLLALGIVTALLECRASGRGQVVDAAMLDGAGMLMAMMYGYRATGRWPAPRAGNIFDGSAYYYRCYECADGRWVAVGAIEDEFRRLFLEKLGLGDELRSILQARDDDPTVHARIADIFRAHDRDYWQRLFDRTDACVSPVLAMDEVLEHPHNREWGSFAVIDGITQPRSGPHFSRTPLAAPETGTQYAAARLAEWGLAMEDAQPA